MNFRQMYIVNSINHGEDSNLRFSKANCYISVIGKFGISTVYRNGAHIISCDYHKRYSMSLDVGIPS